MRTSVTYHQGSLLVVMCLIMECIGNAMSEGCDKLKLSDTLYQNDREGVYKRLSVKCNGRPVYSSGNNYIYFIYVTGWQGWMVGPTQCTNSGGLALESDSFYPEHAGGIWEEVYEDNWYPNSFLTLKCYTLSTGTIVGIVLGVLMAISLSTIIFSRIRHYQLRKRRLNQPQRQQISTVTGGSYPGAQGPQYPRPTRPHPPVPRMQQGYGHGPMMKPGVHGPMAPGLMVHPIPPPQYRPTGLGAPMPPGYPPGMNLGPPPPYEPPPYSCYPPPPLNSGYAGPPPTFQHYAQQPPQFLAQEQSRHVTQHSLGSAQGLDSADENYLKVD